MFWWIVLAVAVVGFVLAWWSSGRAKGRRNPIDPSSDPRLNAAYEESYRNEIRRIQPPGSAP